MLDANTKKACKDDPLIREIKIRNIEHAIDQAELMIKESKMSQEELIFLKRKISDSRQDLEILYFMKIQWIYICKSLKGLNFCKDINLYIWRLIKFKGNVIICIKFLVMSKNNLYIPLKIVPYIFISITAIAITAATYVIT